MWSYLHVYRTKWFWICCVNEDMDRNGCKPSGFFDGGSESLRKLRGANDPIDATSANSVKSFFRS